MNKKKGVRMTEDRLQELTELAEKGDHRAQYELLQYYREIGDHAKAGKLAKELNLFPELDFLTI